MKGVYIIKEVELFKNGIFYNAYGDSALILNYYFNYKIDISNKVGFPEKSLDKIINTLESNHINYSIYNKEDIIIYKKYNKNNYSKILKLSNKNYLNKLELNKLINVINTLDESSIKRIINIINNELKD